MTRLLHVITGLGTGGAERFLASLAPRLAARGFEQIIVSIAEEGPTAQQLVAQGLPVAALGVRGVVTAPLALQRLSRIIKSFAPHAIQGWMYHGDLLATLARRLRGGRHKPKLYWGIRCSDMNLDDYSPQLRLVVGACTWLSGRPDLIVANSDAGARVHAAAGYRARAWAVIPNGIDADRFRPDPQTRVRVRDELGLAHDAAVVVHVARVDPMKDHATMIAATKELPGAATILVGKDTQRYAQLPNIIALGARGDVDRILTAGDIIVSSSAYGEGFSNAIAEGMAAGLVPVATNVGDARAIIGDTGTVVPPRSPSDLAGAIRAELAGGHEARLVRGAAARQRIVSEFSIDKAADRFAAIYRGTGSDNNPNRNILADVQVQ
jgi:glycosyltransferase involved in cell wall biosynthesis